MVDIYDSAASVVEERFESSEAYADDAWSKAEWYIDRLVAVASEFDLPTMSIVYTFDEVDIDALMPSVPTEPSVIFFYEDQVYTSDLKDALKAALLTGVENGGTGLGTAVEAALWARARARNDLSNARVYEEAENFFASRGFTLPPGVLAGRLAEAVAERTRSDNQMNYEITIEQARLAQTNTHFFLTTSLQMEEVDMTNAAKAAQRVFEATKFSQEAMIAVYDSRIKGYAAEVTGVAATVDAKTKSYAIKLEHENNLVKLKIAEADNNLKAAITEYELLLEAMKSGAQVSAQMAASALSSINTAAQLGFSGSESHRYDETRAVPNVSHMYSGDL